MSGQAMREGGAGVDPAAATITICGALQSATIAALVEIAMSAGAALMLQPPRQPFPVARQLAGVVEVAAVSRGGSRRGGRRPDARLERPPKMARLGAARAGTRAGKFDVDALRAALRSGPMAPRDLARVLNVDRSTLRYQLKLCESAGMVVSTGATANRRIALSGKPAKEVP